MAKTQSYTVLEKCSLEEKVEMRQMRCEELHEEIVGMCEMIRIIIRQKLGVEEKLEISTRRCEEMDGRILKIGREIEELKQKKTDADQIEELMWNEIRTLRRQKLGVEKKLESSIRKCEEMEERLLDIGRENEGLILERFDRNQTIEELTWKGIDAEEKIRILMHDKLCVEGKLKSSNTKCEEMEEKLVKTVREMDDLRREKLDANQTMENLKRKEIVAKEKTRILMREKLGVEEKLKGSNRKCEDMEKRLLERMREIEALRREKFDTYQTMEKLKLKEIDAEKKIKILMREKLCVEEKLKGSSRKCEEVEEKLLKTGREIEDLRREKLQRKNAKASQTINNELRVKKMESCKAAEVYKSIIGKLEQTNLKLERHSKMLKVSKMLSVNVEDFPNLVNGTGNCGAAPTDSVVNLLNIVESGSHSLENGMVNAEGDAMSPKFHATRSNSGGGGGIGLSKKVTKCTSCTEPKKVEEDPAVGEKRKRLMPEEEDYKEKLSSSSSYSSSTSSSSFSSSSSSSQEISV